MTSDRSPKHASLCWAVTHDRCNKKNALYGVTPRRTAQDSKCRIESGLPQDGSRDRAWYPPYRKNRPSKRAPASRGTMLEWFAPTRRDLRSDGRKTSCISTKGTSGDRQPIDDGQHCSVLVVGPLPPACEIQSRSESQPKSDAVKESTHRSSSVERGFSGVFDGLMCFVTCNSQAPITKHLVMFGYQPI